MCSNVECLCWTCIWFCFAVDAIVVVISFQCSPIKYTIDNISVYRYIWLWKLVCWGKNRSSTHLEFVNRYKGHLFSAPLRENDVLHICLMYDVYKYTVQGNSLHFANIKEKASLNAVAARLITYFLGSILMNDFSPWFAVLEDGNGIHFCLAGAAIVIASQCHTLPGMWHHLTLLCRAEVHWRGDWKYSGLSYGCSNPFVESLCSATVCFLLSHFLPSWLLTLYFGVFS